MIAMNTTNVLDFTVIIPARYGSSRLPGKPLELIGGKPIIQHVVERAQQSRAQRIIVATDDDSIANVVKAFGAEVCMTRADHASGTDRLEEVAERIDLPEQAIVVNVQGDEPLIPPAVINQVATQLQRHPQASTATLSEKINNPEDFANPNVVKVVTDRRGFALYFSRAAIPHDREQRASAGQRHIGIYAYRVGLLKRFVRWPLATLENVEKLEQLRILANGEVIHVSEALEPVPGGIDTLEDLQALRSRFRHL
ncbi:MAG: 3-deoxy-manno-octulosonate cytidylyltransferase (CMP-KDO synthetase) [Cellvibrionaceae bacterium]|jgi:3-deoxy-manno-octulosonate cytidylyltransferase (CMP-KDO synthetase)